MCRVQIHALDTTDHDETRHLNAPYYIKTTNYEQGRARVAYHPKPNKQERDVTRDATEAPANMIVNKIFTSSVTSNMTSQ